MLSDPLLCVASAASGDKLHSLDYAGFVLGQQQQLISPAYTLAGFQQYLVLQLDKNGAHSGASKKVLIPFGRVCCDRPASAAAAAPEGRGHAGRVRVEVQACCGAKIEVRLSSRLMSKSMPLNVSASELGMKRYER